MASFPDHARSTWADGKGVPIRRSFRPLLLQNRSFAFWRRIRSFIKCKIRTPRKRISRFTSWIDFTHAPNISNIKVSPKEEAFSRNILLGLFVETIHSSNDRFNCNSAVAEFTRYESDEKETILNRVETRLVGRFDKCAFLTFHTSKIKCG